MLEKKIIYVCIEIYKIHESDENDEMFECLTRLNKKKLIAKNKLVRKYNNFKKKIEQNQHSLTAKSIYRFGDDSFRFIKFLGIL